MSHLLWKYFWENDVDRFRRLLAPAGHGSQTVSSKSPAIGAASSYLGGSPGGFGTSPRPANKSRKSSAHAPGLGRARDANQVLGRAEVNGRDHAGLTVLLRAASSSDPSAVALVQALVEHPAIDLYAQDPESGWNALHRALYSGNVSIARILLEAERTDLTSHGLGSVTKVGQLIKTKDHEGNSPFDVYNSTIATRSLKADDGSHDRDHDSDSGDSVDVPNSANRTSHGLGSVVGGDELFMFGSNKNLSLGVGDEDDRQYPERILLRRPDQLLHRFHQSYLAQHDMDSSGILPGLDEIPTLVRNRPLVIQDVVMSKLHSAILTTDPVSNLYVCGVGRGGRLGLGDENTQFKFVAVQGPLADKKMRHVALGQNHSLAIAGQGELWTWGLNSDSQLGYVLPPPMKADEEPMSLVPRQVFGALKKETVLGIAASAIHSVAHTGAAMYCWGRNVGQLALMDADSRSLDVQQTPRKVAASLLAAPIEMVSAIDRATTCLLSNCTVWVFTNYGYNLVKFPFPDVFTNHNLTTTSFSNRYDPGRREIRYIASGGDTIAAVTARGDLFTMHLSNKGDLSQPAASTTNPVKIKGAVTQAQCIWDSRKDGVASVSVGEHGSVIICTESGAVWKRVKRVKFKNEGFAGSSDARHKDFKFERVPYITNCVAVRSSTFGAFAALREDSKVMSEEIGIDEQSLWADVAPLLCLVDFEASQPKGKVDDLRRRWDAAIVREKPGSVAHEILRSPDIEADLAHWLQVNGFQLDGMDMEVCSSATPELKIPVHGWVLAGRSSALRHALAEFRRQGSASSSETFTVEAKDDRVVVTFLNVDVFTVLNVVVYSYQDAIVPVWRYTREAPSQAYRFRQVRTELMKLATKLQMPKLEAAARLQTGLERSLDADLEEAVSDPRFFEDGDVLLELDGAEVSAHSQLLCQRCPFFEGMFNGRSQGQWLAGRRQGAAAERVRVDLGHINPDTFQYVLAFLYADTGPEMFSDVEAATLDEFSELVLDVMGVANELMLDRLSQICQFLIGKFVTTRNIANLLNEISPCSVTAFKDTGLEYVGLQLESMLENHLLDGLDEDLLHELDNVVRDNQLARLPFGRSGRAELLLHERYPELTMDIEEERQRRVRELAFKYTQREDERKLSSSFKARFGSLDESHSASQTPERTRRKSRSGRNEPFSPRLRPKASHGDMIFDMDEDASMPSNPVSPEMLSSGPRGNLDVEPMLQLPKTRLRSDESLQEDAAKSPLQSPVAGPLSPPLRTPDDGAEQLEDKGGRPWASRALPTSKLDLKGIMTEASSTSALTASLAAQRLKDAGASKPQAKMSQKERKKQMQMQAEAQITVQEEAASKTPWEKVTSASKPAPWKAGPSTPKTGPVDTVPSDPVPKGAVPAGAKPLVASEASPKSASRRTASPDTRFSGQSRTTSSPLATSSPSTPQPHRKPLVPHSKSYMSPPSRAEESSPGASMADIIGQQRRERERVREAVAKRSLQEIQQEQEFQEWWDQESRRAQDEEARRAATRGRDRDRGGGSGKRGRRGRGGARGGGGEMAGAGRGGAARGRVDKS